MFIKEGFLYFEPICADLASKFAKSGFKCSLDPQNYFFSNQTIYQKIQNFMLISKLINKLQKIDAQKVIDKKVMEKCTFSTCTSTFKLNLHRLAQKTENVFSK
jgi:hypothetical protein